MGDLVDKDGIAFNPLVHVVDDNGEPLLTKAGLLRRKPGISLEKATDIIDALEATAGQAEPQDGADELPPAPVELSDEIGEVPPPPIGPVKLDDEIKYVYRGTSGSYTLGELKQLVEKMLKPSGITVVPDIEGGCIHIKGGARREGCESLYQPLNVLARVFRFYVNTTTGKDNDVSYI